ncbi:very low-density lipoprotein receptor-like [Littorina saxatilis]|uniref:very low-density lipoprotein receptor-like n=1 Tax=Littorina saxatilis TaxID=31220 RepID=UPI0038B47042
MLRFVILTVLCMGLVAAGASKRKSKHLNKRAAACAENEFQCKNGVCIQEEWTCDSDADCGHGDNSDETLPECPPPGDCTGTHEVKCDNNVCVPLEFRCDGDDDCGDGTDERGCRD